MVVEDIVFFLYICRHAPGVEEEMGQHRYVVDASLHHGWTDRLNNQLNLTVINVSAAEE